MKTLFELRGEKGLTQGELASLAGIGRDTLNGIETGRQKPTAAVAYRITEALGEEQGAIDFSQQSRGGLPLLESEPNVIFIPSELEERVFSPNPSTPKKEPEPESGPVLKEEMALTPPTRTVAPVGIGGYTVVGVGPRKAIMVPVADSLTPVPAPPLPSRWLNKMITVIFVLLAIAIVVIVGYFIYRWYSRRAQQQREAVNPRKPQTVNEFLEAY